MDMSQVFKKMAEQNLKIFGFRTADRQYLSLHVLILYLGPLGNPPQVFLDAKKCCHLAVEKGTKSYALRSRNLCCPITFGDIFLERRTMEQVVHALSLATFLWSGGKYCGAHTKGGFTLGQTFLPAPVSCSFSHLGIIHKGCDVLLENPVGTTGIIG